MKIKNISSHSITFRSGKDLITVLPKATSPDVPMHREDFKYIILSYKYNEVKVIPCNSRDRIIAKDYVQYLYDVDGSFGTYTNLDPVPRDLGGIDKGEVFSKVPFDEMWNKLLYGQSGDLIIDSFLIRDVPNIIEIGQSVPSNCIFEWTVNDPSMVAPNSIKIELTKPQRIIASGLDNTGSYQADMEPVRYVTPEEVSFIISMIDYKGENLTAGYKVNWMYRFYYGALDNPTASVAEVRKFESKLQSNYTNTYNYTDPGFKYILIPRELGTPNKFVDPVTGFDVPMTELTPMSILNDYGVTLTYLVFRTYNKLYGPLNLQLK